MPVGRNSLACSSALLLVSCQLRNFPHEFTENCFAVFDWSNLTIYLMWYWLFWFSGNFLLSFLLRYDFKILLKSRGGGTFLCLALTFGRSFFFFFFFNWKLNIPSFIFLICTEQCWIWFSQKLTKNV